MPVSPPPRSWFYIAVIAVGSIAFVGLAVWGMTSIMIARVNYHAQQRQALRDYHAKQDQIKLRELVHECAAVCRKLGRIPYDSAELVRELRHPLPRIHDGDTEIPVSYHRCGDHYLLKYELWASDDWIYDSSKPDAGWVQHFY